MLRRRVLLLILAALLPVLALAGGMGALWLQNQQALMRSEAIRDAAHLLDNVERDFDKQFDMLALLARSPTLRSDTPDLKLFQDVATQFQEQFQKWNRVILLDRTPKQVANTFVPYGTPLPDLVETSSFARVLETKAPVLGNVAGPGPLSPGQRQVNLRVPVLDTTTKSDSS